MKARRHGNVAIHHAAIQALEPRVLLAGSSSPDNLVDVNGTLFFTADDGIYGRELWKSNGTPEGTVLVADIVPGGRSSSPSFLTNVNGTLFFTAKDSRAGRELWKSDGTSAGTVRVKDIGAGPLGSDPGNLTNVNGTLFFTAGDQVDDVELWKSDGSLGGTVRVRDINPGGPGSSPSSLTAVDSNLFFTVNDGENGDLWMSDGTEVGTSLVKDIGASQLTAVGGDLFFSTSVGDFGNELWKSNGTEVGTMLVKDLRPGGAPDCDEYGCAPFEPYGSDPRNLTNVNGTLYFTAADHDLIERLFKSDGTEAGTMHPAGISPFYPSNLINFNGTPYFAGVIDGVLDGYIADILGLYKCDEAAGGVQLVKETLKTGVPNLLTYSEALPSNLTVVNDALFFTAAVVGQNEETTDRELWKSAGTDAGTLPVKNINPSTDPYGNPASSYPSNLTAVNGTLFFTADNGMNGYELWKSDGTQLGTVLVKDLNTTFAELVNGTLVVAGTDTSDTLGLTIRDSTLRVRLNGELLTFPAADVSRIDIDGFGGDDIIDCAGISIPTSLDAGNGDDIVTAGAGADTVSGGEGADRITGGTGDDILSGNAGNDHLDGGLGNDRLNGNGGRDHLSGGGGKDRLFGGANGDFLSGQGGDDQLFGEGGNDRLSGGVGGRDTLHGNAGDDRLISNDGSIDELFGDGGSDTATADADDILSSIETEF